MPASAGHVHPAVITTKKRRLAAPNWLLCAPSGHNDQEEAFGDPNEAFCDPNLVVMTAEWPRGEGAGQ